jgi:hypothetical protein
VGVTPQIRLILRKLLPPVHVHETTMKTHVPLIQP